MARTIKGLEDELSAANQVVAECRATINDLEKKLETEKSNSRSYVNTLTESRKQIEEAHAFLDGISDVPGQIVDRPQRYGGTREVELSLMSRIAGYIDALNKRLVAK